MADLDLDLDPSGGAAGLAEARERLRAWLTEAGVGEPTLHEVVIAVGEATTNAVEHSGAAGQAGRPAVQLHAEIDPDAVLRVRVTDVGHWREPGAEADRARVNRGRGLILMDGLMDQVQVRTDRAGSAVELCKQLPPLRTPAPAPALSKMQLHRATADGALVVTGDIDYVAAPVLRDALQADPAAPAAEQVLDLRAVGYLESAALAVLWEHAHRLRLLVTEDTAVATLMRITGLIHAATVEFTPPS